MSYGANPYYSAQARTGAPSSLNNRQPMFGAPQQQLQPLQEEVDIEKEIDGLRGHVGRLKQMGRDIHSESQLQNQIMHQLEESIEKAKMLMSQGMQRLQRASRHTKSQHLLLLILFAFTVFIALYAFKRIISFILWFI